MPTWRTLAAAVVLGAASLTHPLYAQTPAAKFVDSARVLIDRAVEKNSSADLERAVALLDKALLVYQEDPYLLHYRGYAHYRQVVTAFLTNTEAAAEPLIEKALDDLTRSSAKLEWAESWMLRSSLTGMLIGMHPERGQELGMQIGNLTAKAVALGPQNPRVALLEAYGAMNTPEMWGGGVAAARAHAERAVARFEKDQPGPLAPRWGRYEAAALLKDIVGGATSVKRP